MDDFGKLGEEVAREHSGVSEGGPDTLPGLAVEVHAERGGVGEGHAL